MAREPMQDKYQVRKWLLFRKPGAFFYDYALRFDQRNYEDGECVIECPWLGKTFKSWLWTLAAHKEFLAAAHAAVTARSGGWVYDNDDGAFTQAYWQEQEIFLEGPASARRRPLICGTAAQRMTDREDAMMEMPVATGPGVRQIGLFEMLARGGNR